MKEESGAGYKLAMPGGVEFGLNKAEVGKREILKLSMMPEGQFDALGPDVAAQLVAYLQKDRCRKGRGHQGLARFQISKSPARSRARR